MGKRIAVVVPAYNEERLVERSVRAVPGYVDHVIVVNDASSDGTEAAAKRAADRPGYEYFLHKENRGVGGAIVTGYGLAVERGADIVAVMAGDAQMDPEDLAGVLAPVAEGTADYSKGDRLSYPGVFSAMPLTRFIGNHVLSLMTRLSSGYRQVRDSQCGFTAVSTAALRRMKLGELYTRYGFPNDMLAHLHSAGARLAQVPVRAIYGEEVSGISWFTALFRVPRVLWRSFFQRRRREAQAETELLEPARRA